MLHKNRLIIISFIVLNYMTLCLAESLCSWEFGNDSDLLAGWVITNVESYSADEHGINLSIDYHQSGNSNCQQLLSTILKKDLTSSEKALSSKATHILIDKGKDSNAWNSLCINVDDNGKNEKYTIDYGTEVPNENVTIVNKGSMIRVVFDLRKILTGNITIKSIEFIEGLSLRTLCNEGFTSTATRTYSSICLYNEIPPQEPILNLPLNNSLNCNVPVSLQWSGTNDISTFNLQISNTHNFTKLIVDREGIKQSNYTSTILLGGTKYYWRVRKVNKIDQESLWSTTGNFTTTTINETRLASGMENNMQYNSIRIAYYGCGEEIANGHVDDFLQKAKDYKYNYVLAEFAMDRGRKTSLLTKKEDFKLAFKRVNDFGLRLIPLIQVGSGWAHHWYHAQVNWNTNIKMTRVIGTNEQGTRGFGCPSFSYDSTGFDQTFVEFLQQVKAAHSEANVNYPLEFIHLGHDEPAYYTRLLVGDCKIGDGSDWSVNSVTEVCAADKSFIQNYSGSKSTAVQELFVTELFRRTEQVKSNLGSNVRVMIYGDIWDPQMNGQRNMELWDGTIVNTTPGIATLPGLTNSQKEQMREKLVILPWNYDKSCDYDGDGEYKANETFDYLSSNGFKFIYVHEITANNIYPYDNNRVAQANEYFNFSRSYKENCLGYGAVHWDGWAYPVPKCFDSMWYLYNLNSKDLPLKDFKNDLSPILNLLMID